ncbi:hypothetical protein HDU96_004705, partial [Phlyctochytrium bullatum]
GVATHVGRLHIGHLRYDDLDGDQKKRAGRWNLDSQSGVYGNPVPTQAVRRIAGFPKEKGTYFLDRDQVKPPSSLIQQDGYGDHAIWKHDLFQSAEFLSFKDAVTTSCSSTEAAPPRTVLMVQVIPEIAARLQHVSAQVNTVLQRLEFAESRLSSVLSKEMEVHSSRLGDQVKQSAYSLETMVRLSNKQVWSA